MEMRNWGLGFSMGPTRVPIEFEARVPKEEKGTRAWGGGGDFPTTSARGGTSPLGRDFLYWETVSLKSERTSNSFPLIQCTHLM
jgi:hypothetical protein